MGTLVRTVLIDFTQMQAAYKNRDQFRHTLSIKGDEALIKQVMINLISNAIKCSSKKDRLLTSLRN
jgi:signal transduction histidine kinase